MNPINHWNPAVGAFITAQIDKRAVRRVEFFSGLDGSVLYLTIRDVAARADVSCKVVRYALSKLKPERGYMEAARRQPGRAGVLIHPDEAGRWLAERNKRKTKC